MSSSEQVSPKKLERILTAAYDKYKLLVPALELMIHYRIETLRQLNDVANKLDKRHRSGNIGRLVGAATGLAGTGVAATGVVLSPFTAGAAAPLIAGGFGLVFIGAGTALGTHVTEKVLEKVDLEKVQQAIDRDREQCEKVKELWETFENYCDETINTIALADPSQGSDVASLQTWIQVAMESITSPVMIVAEALHSCYTNTTKALESMQEDNVLFALLGKVSREIIHRGPARDFKSIVSMMCKKLWKVPMTLIFVLLGGIAIGNLVFLIFTLFDMHNGSPSKVAKELRKHSKELQDELDKWLDAFGNQR